MYLAPEVMAGQPPTVQADVYALGVMLYQFVTCNLNASLSPGWERDIEDELLREDIAWAAEGNPVRRLADAAEFARRLRGLEERRAKLQAEREATARVERERVEMERTRQAMEQMRARRSGLMVAVVALLVGLAISTSLYLQARYARGLAEKAAEKAKAISDYLTKDIFAQINSGERSLRTLSVKDLLDTAATQVGQRFAGQPEMIAEVRTALGESYLALDLAPQAEPQLRQALDVYEVSNGPGSEQALKIAADLVGVEYDLGQLPVVTPRLQAVLAEGQKTLGPLHPAVLQLRLRLALGESLLGQYQPFADDMHALWHTIESSNDTDPVFAATVMSYYGMALYDLGQLSEAEAEQREALLRMRQKLPDSNVQVAKQHSNLAVILMERGKLEEADRELSLALSTARNWVSDATGLIVTLNWEQARLRLAQGRPAEAEAIASKTLVEWQSAFGSEMDQTGLIRHVLGQAYQAENNLVEAEKTLREAVQALSRSLGPTHPNAISARIDLAAVLLQSGDAAKAESVLHDPEPIDLSALPHDHPLKAELLRVLGLLAMLKHQVTEARAELGESLAINQRIYGSQHWRTQRALRELAAVHP
jgi:tetratricopeptide (TPR) repeat protein